MNESKKNSPRTVFSTTKGFSPAESTMVMPSQVDLTTNKSYLNRLKKANYGQWYISPDKYEVRNKRLNQELYRHNLA